MADKKEINPNLLQGVEGTLLMEVLCVTDKEIQEFLTAEATDEVNTEKGEKPIGKLPNLAIAFFVVAHRTVDNMGKKLEVLKGITPEKEDEKTKAKAMVAELELLKEQAEMCRGTAWNIIRANLSENADQIAYRKDGVVASCPPEKRILDEMFPHIHILEVGVLRMR